MKEFIFIFKNTHSVLKADEVLEKALVEREIIPTPKTISSECGLSIKVQGDFEYVLDLLKKDRIFPEKIVSFPNLEVLWKA